MTIFNILIQFADKLQTEFQILLPLQSKMILLFL